MITAELFKFCEKKIKGIPELPGAVQMADLAFAVAVTSLIYELNTKLQGEGLFAYTIIASRLIS